MKLPAYPRTKPSGVEWLGDVPEHWEVKRFRFCVRASNAGEVIDRSYWHSGDELLFSCQRESMISDFPDFPLRKRTTENDLLVTRNGTPYVHVPPANAIYSNVVQRCTLKDGPLRSFVALALETACERLRGDGYGVSIPSFSYEKWCDLSLPLPAPAEQQAIAAFLDRETGRVDRLVAKKRELIERLKEKRTALISRTVTRGLPPAAARAAGLPENPPLKPSGIEWIGEIPKHWEARRLKDVGTLKGGAGFPHDEQGLEDEELPFYKVGDLKASLDGRVMTKPEHTISMETARKLRAAVIPPRSIVYAKIGAALLLNRRRVTFADCCIDNNMTAYLPDERRIRSEWAFYWLSILDFGEFMNPGAVPSFSEGYQAILPVLLPPLPEQAAIAAYLDEETAKLDALVVKVEEAVERLQEYRTALITAAVTGKIDVRQT